MLAMLGGGLWRVASIYTAALWIAGFVWARIDLAATGQFHGLIGLLFDLPGIVVTMVCALFLQAVMIVAHHRGDGRIDAVRSLGVLTLIAVASLASGGVDTLAHAEFASSHAPAVQDWAPRSRGEWFRISFVYSWMYCVNVVLVLLAISIHRTRQQAAQLVRAHEAAHTAQLTMLRYQLNPHFLFNTLNAISSLVLTRQNEAAERMIERLAAFLRSANTADAGGLVPLADELSTIADYLDVEAVRFGERMRATFDIAPGAGDVLVPGFLLQPLVENAVKYAIAPRQGNGEIRITARETAGRLALMVADDGPADTPAGGTGIGLANVCARLQAFFGDAAECRAARVADGFVAQITMPAQRIAATVQPAPATRRDAGGRQSAETLVAQATSSPPTPSFR